MRFCQSSKSYSLDAGFSGNQSLHCFMDSGVRLLMGVKNYLNYQQWVEVY